MLVPIRRVGQAARRLAAGDLAARVVERGGGEVADLGRSFNAMADSLEHTRDELESQNSELEAQQAELERAVDELAREKERVERLTASGAPSPAAPSSSDVCRTVLAELAGMAGAELGACTSARATTTSPSRLRRAASIRSP